MPPTQAATPKRQRRPSGLVAPSPSVRPPRMTPSKRTKAATPRMTTPRKADNTTVESLRKTPKAKKADFENTSLSSEGEEIQVVVRLRPLKSTEVNQGRAWKVLQGNTIVEDKNPQKAFTYDKVFDEEIDTKTIYDSSAKRVVDSVLAGVHGTLFAYGQTSSGKTFTMQGSGSIAQGSANENGGIIHLAINDIFAHIQAHPERIFSVKASFLEVYLDDVFDLLSTDKRQLRIRQDAQQRVFVESDEVEVSDIDSLLAVLEKGEVSRQFATTKMNQRSSRSHSIFRVTITSFVPSKEKDETGDPIPDGPVRTATLNLVDLAGSEGVKTTNAKGVTLTEGNSINRSLLTLGRVISDLGQPNSTHVAYRDSSLTYVLQSSLSGNARLAIICCVSPSALYCAETLNSLKFAQGAKAVKTYAQINEAMDDKTLIRNLKKQLKEWKARSKGDLNLEENEELNTKVQQLEEQITSLKSRLENQNRKNIPTDETRPDQGKRRHSDGGIHAIHPTKKPRLAGESPSADQIEKFLLAARESSLAETVSELRAQLAKAEREREENEQAMIAKHRKETEKLKAMVKKNEQTLTAKHRKETEKLKAMVQEHEQALDEYVTENGREHEKLISENKTLSENQEKVTFELEEARRLNEDLTQKLTQSRNECQSSLARVKDLETRQEFERTKILSSLSELEEKHSILEANYNAISDEKNNLETQLAAATAEMETQRIQMSTIISLTFLRAQRLHDTAASKEISLTQNISLAADNAKKTRLELERLKENALDSTKRMELLSDELRVVCMAKQELSSELEQSQQLYAQSKAESEQRISELSLEIRNINEKFQEASQKLRKIELELDATTRDRESLCAQVKEGEVLRVEILGQKAELEKKLLLLEEDNKCLSSDLEVSGEELNVANDDVKTLTGEIAALNASNQAFEARLAETKALSTKLYEQLENERMDFGAKQERLVALQATTLVRLERLQQDAARAKEQLQKELECTGSDLAAREAQVEAAQSRLADANRKLSDLANAQESLSKQAIEYQETLDVARAETKELKLELSDTKKKFEAAQCEAETSNEAIDVIKAEKLKLEETIKALEATISTMEGNARTLRDENDGLLSAIEGKTREVERLTSSFTEVCGKLKELEDSSVQLREEVRDFDSRYSLLQNQLASSESKREALSTELNSTKEIVQKLEESNRSTVAELENLEKNHNSTIREKTNVHISRDLARERVDRLEAAVLSGDSQLNNISSSLKDREAEVHELQAHLDRSLEEIQSLISQKSELQVELEQAKLVSEKESESFRAQLLAADQEIQKAHVTMKNRQYELTEMNETIAHLSTSLSDIQAEYESLQMIASDEKQKFFLANSLLCVRWKKSESNNAELNLQVENLLRDLNNESRTRETLAVDLDRVRNERDDAQTLNRDLESQLTCTRDECNTLSSRIDEMEQWISSANKNIDDLDRMKIHLEERLAAMTECEMSLQNSLAAKDNECKGLKDSLKVAENRLQTLETAKEIALARLRRLETGGDVDRCHLQAALTEIEVKEQEYNSIKAELQKEKDRIIELETHIETLVKSRSEVELESQAASELVESLQEELQGVTAKYSVLCETVEAYRVEIEDFHALRGNLEQAATMKQSAMEMQCSEIASLQADKTNLEKSCQTLKQRLADLEDLLNDTKEQLENKSSSFDEQFANLQSEKSMLEEELTKVRDESNSRADELIKVHDLVESTNASNTNIKKDLADLAEALATKDTMLSEAYDALEKEKAHAAEQVHELSNRVSELIATQSRTESSEATAEEVEDLKGLLAYANKSVEDMKVMKENALVDLEKAEARSNQLEELIQTLQNQSLSQVDGSEVDMAQLEAMISEVSRLTSLLEDEKQLRANTEQEMQSHHEKERRQLIHDAEEEMLKLRKEKDDLKTSLEKLDSDAYAAREIAEELRDENKRLIDKSIQLESRLSALENENSRLKRSADRFENERDTQASALQLELKRAREESTSVRDTQHALESRLAVYEERLAQKDRELREVLASTKNLDVPSLERKIEFLQAELNKSKEQLQKEETSSAIVLDLKRKIDTLSTEIQAKDKKIRKLKKTALSQERVEFLKNQKRENEELKSQNADLLEKIEVAEKTLSELSASGTQTDNAEITRLRFAKDALDKKARKYVAHCQRLEDEFASIRTILQSNNSSIPDKGTLAPHVSELADRVTSLEEECNSMSRSEISSSSYVVEIEKLRDHNRSLQFQLSEYSKKLEQFSRTEIQLKESIRRLKEEIEPLQNELQKARSTVSEMEQITVSKRKYHRLEEDHLQLMKDFKAKKEELAKYKAELNATRLNAVSTYSTKTGPSPSLPRKVNSNKRSAPLSTKQSGPPALMKDLENTENGAEKVPLGDVPSEPPSGSERKRARHRTPGLGEALAPNNENTQECKQS